MPWEFVEMFAVQDDPLPVHSCSFLLQKFCFSSSYSLNHDYFQRFKHPSVQHFAKLQNFHFLPRMHTLLLSFKEVLINCSCSLHLLVAALHINLVAAWLSYDFVDIITSMSTLQTACEHLLAEGQHIQYNTTLFKEGLSSTFWLITFVLLLIPVCTRYKR